MTPQEGEVSPLFLQLVVTILLLQKTFSVISGVNLLETNYF